MGEGWLVEGVGVVGRGQGRGKLRVAARVVAWVAARVVARVGSLEVQLGLEVASSWWLLCAETGIRGLAHSRTAAGGCLIFKNLHLLSFLLCQVCAQVQSGFAWRNLLPEGSQGKRPLEACPLRPPWMIRINIYSPVFYALAFLDGGLGFAVSHCLENILLGGKRVH